MFGQNKCRLNNLQTAFPYPQAQPHPSFSPTVILWITSRRLPGKPRLAADGVQAQSDLAGVTAIPRYLLQLHRLNGYSIKMPSETLRSFRRHLSFPNYKSNSAATGAWSLGRSKARVSKSTRTSFKTAAISDVTNIWSIRRPSLRWNIAPR